MHNLAQIPSISPEEYLAIERASPIRHEYINGVMYAMAGGSLPHSHITVSLSRLLSTHLLGRSFECYNNDLRVLNRATGSYLYPDLLVICGEPILTDLHKDTIVNPLIIVEVLSPSTEAFDKGDKFAHYKLLDSFQVYVLVSQNQPRIEKFTRKGDVWELSESLGLDSTFTLEAIEFSTSLRDVYYGVTFDDPPPRASSIQPTTGNDL